MVFLPNQPRPARRAKSRSKSGGVATGLAMTLHVVHLAGEALRQPLAEAAEPIRLCSPRDAHQVETQAEAMLFQAVFEGSHRRSELLLDGNLVISIPRSSCEL